MKKYKVGNTYYGYDESSEHLAHFRTPGSKNGQRLYQYEDGSYTPLGRRHYGIGDPRDANANPAERMTGRLLNGRNVKNEIDSFNQKAFSPTPVRKAPYPPLPMYAKAKATPLVDKEANRHARDVAAMNKHFQDRQNAYAKYNTPQGKVMQFIDNSVTGIRNKTGLSRRDYYATTRAQKEEAGNKVNAARRALDESGRAVRRGADPASTGHYEKLDDWARAQEEYGGAWDEERRAKAAYDQTPLGRTENFVRNAPGAIARGIRDIPGQIAQGAQSVGNAVSQIPQNVSQVGKNIGNMIGLDARNAYQNAAGQEARYKHEYQDAVKDTQQDARHLARIDEINKKYPSEYPLEREGPARELDNSRSYQALRGQMLADSRRQAAAAKNAYDQTPLGRVENFAGQVGQGVQNIGSQIGQGAQKVGNLIGQGANNIAQGAQQLGSQIGQGAQNAWNAVSGGVQQLGNQIGEGVQNAGAAIRNVVSDPGYAARQLGGQIDRGLNLGVETGRILDAARGNQARAQDSYDAAKDNYFSNTDASDPQRTVELKNAAHSLVNANKTVDAWEQQYGGTVIGGVRNAIQQGQQLLSNLLANLFGRR